MICKSAVVLYLLAIGFGSTLRYNEEEYDRYHGPPAPLNPDGTVAFTPEYEHIRDEHKAAFEREYEKIRNSINAADPYNIPDTLKTHGNEDAGHYLPEIHEEETYDSPAPVEDEGQYNPELYEKPYSWLYDDGQYRPNLYDQDQKNNEEYVSAPTTQGSFHRPAYAPATLNTDGTVAHTPEYNAIASSFLAYHQALSRHRRSAERYQGPPAPLNHDLTVDYTPEVKHFHTAHFTSVANQFKRLQETVALAAAHPDRTSPPSKDYNPQNNIEHLFVPQPHHHGQHLWRKKRSYAEEYSPQQPYARQYDDGQYRPHHYKYDDGQYKPHLHQVVDYNTEPFRPAPLNPDGTVAHVPEYHAIAASHLAAHHNALSIITGHH